MAVDITRQGTKGGDPDYNTTNLRGVPSETGIVLGVVKANVHGSHMGVIQVYIPSYSTNPEDKTQWRTVKYCTPFYSRVESRSKNETTTKVPAGIVTPPPDLGTTVLCFFPEGKNHEGFYFACVPDTFMLQTLPEPTKSRTNEVSGEFNDKNPLAQVNKITNWKAIKRPVDSINQKINKEQGLDQDNVRGLNNSGYMRESPSEVIGIASKGRRITDNGQDFLKVNRGSLLNIDGASDEVRKGLLGPTNRRRGHTLTLDDGDVDGNSNQIRLRTSTGHQILMNDSTGIIYIGNNAGTTWIELGKQGTVDVFATDSINFRTKNINFHADENIKFHSKGYTQVVSEQQMHLESKDDMVLKSGGDAGITSKAFAVKASGMMNLSGGAASSISASGIMSVKGSLVLLQGPALGSKTAKSVRPMQKLDTKYDANSGRYVPDTSKLTQTTVDRLVVHEPSVATHNRKNETTAYTGGLAGGGGLAGAFAIIGAVASAAPALGQINQTGLAGTTGVQSNLSNISNSSTFVGKAGIDGVATATIPRMNFDSIPSIGGGGFDFGGLDFGTFGDTIGETFTSISDSVSGVFTSVSESIGGDGIGLDPFGGAGGDVGFVGDFSNITRKIPDTITTVGGEGFNFDFKDIGDSISSTISSVKSSVSDTIAKFGNQITGTDITSIDFPGLDFTNAETDLSAFGGAGPSVGFVGGFSNITNSVAEVTGSQLSSGQITNIFNSNLGDLANATLGSLVTDEQGKIINIASSLSGGEGILNNIGNALTTGPGDAIGGPIGSVVNVVNAVSQGIRAIPGLQDKLPSFLSEPIDKVVEVTDMLKELDTGFSIGALESVDIQGLNAAVVKKVGSGGLPSFVDPVTKVVGKYGFDVEQLKANGFVRPEAKFNDQLGFSSVWTGKDNITTLSKFQQNLGVQENLQKSIIAKNYQDLVTKGGIFTTDKKPEIMGMLTGAQLSNVDIVKKVRSGLSVDMVARNTTSIPHTVNVNSFVEDAIKTGASASKTITKIVDKKVTGGGVTTETRTSKVYDPYDGPNGGIKRSLDERINKLEDDRARMIFDGNITPQVELEIDSKLRDLYARRNAI